MRRGGRRWMRARGAVLKRAGGECERCRRWHGSDPEVHHQIAVAARPDLEFAHWNLLVVCRECHAKLEARRVDGAERRAAVGVRADEGQSPPPPPPPPSAFSL